MKASKKKIAVVVPKYGLVGGGELFVSELTERLAQKPDYDIHVFANQWRKQSDKITFHKVPIIAFPKWMTTISFAYFANRKIASMDFDLVHTHDRIFKADICTLHFIPHRIWVREIRGKKRLSLFDRTTCCVERRFFESGNCRIFMPVSNLAKEKMLEEYQVDPDKIHVVHPGVDVEKFKKKDVAVRQEVRKEFGIQDTDMLVLFVGMNYELKGLDNLLKAVSLIKKINTNHDIKVLVAGKGNIKKYESMADQLGIGSNVIFAGVCSDIARIYQAGDILALLSGFDTFGMVVTEAMAAGLPVIISDKVGAKDLVRDGENGFVVQRDCVNEIRSRIIYMVNEEVRSAMSSNARNSVRDYPWEIIARRVMKLYDGLWY
ncbi:MAG TPA: glycosyltransferase family 1 protein [Deltaproteobacteria bacterium]|nr:glycosyltransferase family 1 protein [Deltaproteobacteria bacterium]